ncbi:MAG: tetratricopeptide repeat protein [Planctomycetota bacterium]|nr:MAG: tetratricopeptide repeat protein [Planctomycetota bacterium]
MKRTGWLAMLLALLPAAGGAHAQRLMFIPAGPGDSAPRSSVHPRHSFTVCLSSFPCAGGYGGLAYPRPLVTRVTFVYAPPPLLGLAPAYVTPSPSPVILSGDPELDQILLPGPRLETPIPSGFLDPGVPVSVFRPIRPEDRLRAQMPLQPEIAPPPPREPRRQELPAPNKRAPRSPEKPLPGPPVPEVEPRKECARQIRLGRQAFAERAYALAERCFGQAVAVCPEEPITRFLLAEAQFALGKYQEAVASVDAGLERRQDWPDAFFWPRDLYEIHWQDFDANMKRLADVIARYPDDPVLLFLYAYHLWFDGRRDETRGYFLRADAAAAGPKRGTRFLPPQPVLPFIPW